MTILSIKHITITLLALTLLACSAPVGNGESSKIPADYEIADVRNLPQEMGAYVSSFRGNYLDKTCQSNFLSEFRLKFYSPWTEKVYITDVNDSLETMKMFLRKVWYGENRRGVTKSFMDELAANCDLESFPSMKQTAVVTSPTDLRVLPTAKPLFENADDFPFDVLQNARLKLNEPIRVLHRSRDGLWFFVETADTNGWIESRDAAFVDMNAANALMGEKQLVILRDNTLIHDGEGTVVQKVRTGTLCPLVSDEGDYYVVAIPVNTGRNGLRLMGGSIAKKDAVRFPLKADRQGMTLVGNELAGKPYGWGEKYQDRDCSALVRDFYMPFGIWFPRGSYNQINSGKNIPINLLDDKEKERLIKEKGIPFLTLIYLKGHIMIYLGEKDARPVVFHSIWGVNVKNGKDRVTKQVIGKAIISTLNPGSELNLATGSLLGRVCRILNLGDRCSGANNR